MVKKLFALASVTALTGLIAAVAGSGCSSTTSTDTGAPAEAGSDAKVTKDATPADDAATGGGVCPSTTAVTAAEVDAQLKWLAPPAVKNVCTQANLDALRALFSGTGSVKFTDINAALGTTCAACAFSNTGAANWSVFAEWDPSKGAIDNAGPSCFAQVKDAACGKARFHFETCLDIACPRPGSTSDSTTECATDAKAQSCFPKTIAKGGACEAIGNEYTAACPDEAGLIKVCGGLVPSVAIGCSGGVDGGLDAAVK